MRLPQTCSDVASSLLRISCTQSTSSLASCESAIPTSPTISKTMGDDNGGGVPLKSGHYKGRSYRHAVPPLKLFVGKRLGEG